MAKLSLGALAVGYLIGSHSKKKEEAKRCSEERQLIKRALEQGEVSLPTRQGHSLLLHFFLIGVGVGLFTIPYYSISKKHYWYFQQLFTKEDLSKPIKIQVEVEKEEK